MTTIFTRTYGVEIEMVFGRASEDAGSLARKLTAAGITTVYENYNHALRNHWKLTTDASVHGGVTGSGIELVSPPLTGEEGLQQIERACAVLQECGMTINRSCGLHVHVDARNLPIVALRKLAFLYAECEDVIDNLMTPSRRGANAMFCNTMKNASWPRVAAAQTAQEIALNFGRGTSGNQARYSKVNFTSMWRHGTVEFRQHSGTVFADKINAWVKTCLRMVNAAKREGEAFLATAATAPAPAAPQATGTIVPRPRDRRLGIIFDLIARETGASRQEVAQALGRSTMPPLRNILEEAQIPFDMVNRGRRIERYRLRGVAGAASQPVRSVPAAPAMPATFRPIATLVEFATRLGMDNAELAYWNSRHETLNA